MLKYFIVVLVFFQFSCERLTSHERVDVLSITKANNSFYLSNGLVIKINKITPIDKVFLEYGNNLDSTFISKEIERNSYMLYYNLILDDTENKFSNGISSDSLERLMYYFSYKFQDDISLVSNDTVRQMNLFHFERNGNISGRYRFSLAFMNKYSDKNIDEIIIESSELKMYDRITIK